MLALPQVVAAGPLTGAAPASGVQGDPELTLDPSEITARQAPDRVASHPLTIGNTGGGDLEWNVFEDPHDPIRLPVAPATGVPHVDPPDPGDGAELVGFPGLQGRPGRVVPVTVPPPPDGAVTLGHTEQPAMVAARSLACSARKGLTTLATSYLRHFTLADFGIEGELAVTGVSFGVESVRGFLVPLTVNLYVLTGPVLSYEHLTLVGSTETSFSPRVLTMVDVPVTGTVPAGATLVVEVAAPDLPAGGFHLAAHPEGETAPSYLSAPACGLPEPAPTGPLGHPELQLLMTVTGAAEVPACDVPGGVPWLAVDPAAGELPPGGSQEMSVTFDSTGFADGDTLATELCLQANDPDRPFVPVPLTLQVRLDPAIEVSPDALAADLDPGESTSEPLTVANVGDADLEWSIEEAPESCDDPADVPWLTVAPEQGTTAPGEQAEVSVAFDATELAAGQHRARLCVTSNDPFRPLVEVPVALRVAGVDCDRTITGEHPEALTVTGGVTCLAPGAFVRGAVNVLAGAGLVATSATIQGPVASFPGNTVMELWFSEVNGTVTMQGGTERVMLVENGIQPGNVFVTGNATGTTPIVISGNMIVGSLLCLGNRPEPTDRGVPNTAVAGTGGQCEGL